MSPFTPLKIRNFRLFIIGQVISTTGLWMQRIAQDWMVLELTGSASMVGITVALQFLPMLMFGLWGGLIVDRYSKRKLMLVTQTVAMGLAAVMAALALTGTLEVWHIFVIAFLLGMVTVVDNPARQVFVNEMVGPDLIRPAVSLNSAAFQISGLVGPALSGLLISQVGAGWSFLLNALSSIVVIAALALVRPAELHPVPTAVKSKGQLKEGLRYALGKPAILWSLVMVAAVSVFGMGLPVMLAEYAKNVFDIGPEGYGWLNGLVALGALAGALAGTVRKTVRLRNVVIAAIVLSAVKMLAAYADAVWLFGASLVVSGGVTMLFLINANSLIQMSSDLTIRGRVMSLYVLVMLGGQAFGGPLTGWWVRELGADGAMFLAGLLPLLSALLASAVLSRTGSLKLELRNSAAFIRIVPRDGDC